MKIKKIHNRSILFTYEGKDIPSGWDLNIQLIKGSHCNYIIDTGLGSLSVAPIKEMIKSDAKPTIVILTHHHWDHVWGNGEFRGCTIVSHALCREMMLRKWDEMLQKNGGYVRGNAELVLPNMTFDHELHFPEDRIRLVYSPGHTVDSICVLDEADRVINVGDNIGDNMDEIVPDLTCEKDVFIQSLAVYQAMDFDALISGHNIVTDKGIFDKILKLL